jgi:hypothetical protein
MALNPRWRKSGRKDHPDLSSVRRAPRVLEWASAMLGLLGILGFLYYLSVSGIAVNFFAQAPP